MNHIIGAIILLASKAIGQYGDLSAVKIEAGKASRLLEIVCIATTIEPFLKRNSPLAMGIKSLRPRSIIFLS